MTPQVSHCSFGCLVLANGEPTQAVVAIDEISIFGLSNQLNRLLIHGRTPLSSFTFTSRPLDPTILATRSAENLEAM